MEIVIRRVPVSDETVGEFSAQISGGDSLFIVGPRYSGRSWLMSHLETALAERDLSPIALKFSSEVPEIEQHAMQRIRAQLRTPWSGPETIAGFFEWLEDEHRRKRRPAVLLLSNIDGMEREAARLFLRQVRTAVNANPRWLTAVISGESQMVNLVAGSNSDLNCGYEYILQGMAESLFIREFARWSERLGIRFEAAGAAETSWRRTGGNFSLVRRFLNSVLDDAIARGNNGNILVTAAELEGGLDRLLSMGPAGAAFFQVAGEIVASSPQSWDLLLRLLESGRLPAKDATPHLLELGGIVQVRSGVMEFSSPMMAEYIKRQFGPRRRGDLEALAGNFETAFQLYRSGGVGSARPLNFQDELVVTSVVRRLSTAFRQSEFEKLEAWLENGVELVLGFGRASRLVHQKDGWAPAPGSAQFPEQFLKYLQPLSPVPGQIVPLGDEPATHGYVVTVSRDWQVFRADAAIAVWEPPELHPINRPRATLLHELLQAFSDAHNEALRSQRNRWLEHLGARLAATTNKVLAGLFVQLTDPDDVLRRAAEQLTGPDTPFQRVVYLQLNPEDGTAAMVFSEPPVQTQPPAPEWLGRLMDCQEVEMLPGKLFSEEDPAAASGAYYVVPIETERWGQARLLLEVKTEASAGLLEPVQAFAGHLNAALRQSERVALVSQALDRIADPVLLFDPSGRHLFANGPAKTLLHLNMDQDREWLAQPADLDSNRYCDLKGYVQNAITQGRRVVSFIDRIAGVPYQGIVVSDVLKYRSGRPAGVLVHIPDQQYYAEMLHALEVLETSADEEAALGRLVEIFRAQGHDGIRVYGLDETGTHLQPRQCYDPRPEVMQQFHTVQLPPESQNPFTWRAIATGRPCVFKVSEDRHGQTFYTARGLEVIRISNPPEAARLQKKVGDYWIDFPLMRGGAVTGKITLNCDEKLSPERLEMLRVFSGIVGRTLENLRSRKTEVEQTSRATRGRWQQEMFEMMSNASPILDTLTSIDIPSLEAEQAVRTIEAQLRSAFQEMMSNVRREERTAWSM